MSSNSTAEKLVYFNDECKTNTTEFDKYKSDVVSRLDPEKELLRYKMMMVANYLKYNEDGVKKMDENRLLEKYMDKVDADQKNLKEEMREREERMIKATAESEMRVYQQLSKIEKMIEVQSTSVNDKFEKMENKFDNSVKEIKSNKIAIWGICIATILSVAGIAYAAMQVFQNFVNIVLQ